MTNALVVACSRCRWVLKVNGGMAPLPSEPVADFIPWGLFPAGTAFFLNSIDAEVAALRAGWFVTGPEHLCPGCHAFLNPVVVENPFMPGLISALHSSGLTWLSWRVFDLYAWFNRGGLRSWL